MYKWIHTPKRPKDQNLELKSDLAARPQLWWELWALLDWQDVARSRGAEVSKGRTASQDQELKQQASLGEWSHDCLEEFALQYRGT